MSAHGPLIGVLGAGQLGRMMALAGIPLGARFRFLDPNPDSPAGRLGELVVAPYDDADALRRFAEGLDAVTYEFENVPAAATDVFAACSIPVYPPPEALRVSQDRLVEKETLNDLGIPTPPFVPVESFDALRRACVELGYPAVLKTRRFGYDGKGQARLYDDADIDPAWEQLHGAGPLILESFVTFDRELSLLCVRGRDGATAFYPLCENTHRAGILRESVFPAENAPDDQARALGGRLLDHLDYVGVLAIEFFDVGGRLLVNEIAPRVHNSGHGTIEGAETSQFENHVRAVMGLPLGSTRPVGVSIMHNIIGNWPDRAALLAIDGAHVHDYEKVPRRARKIGHVTVRATSRDAVAAPSNTVAELIKASADG